MEFYTHGRLWYNLCNFFCLCLILVIHMGSTLAETAKGTLLNMVLRACLSGA